MIASLVKTQFHPILKQAICKQEVFFLKQINFLDKETQKERREKKNPKYQPADNKISQHLILLGKNIKFIFKCDILI